MHAPGIDTPLEAAMFVIAMPTAEVASVAVTSLHASTELIVASLLGDGDASGEFEAVLPDDPPHAAMSRANAIIPNPVRANLMSVGGSVATGETGVKDRAPIKLPAVPR